MFDINDLIEACYSNNYIQIIKVLKDLEKYEYVSELLIDCFLGSVQFLHEDILIRILEYEYRLAFEYFHHYDTYLLLYTLETGLNKLSNKIMDIMVKYDSPDFFQQHKLNFGIERYNNILNHCNSNQDNVLFVACYAHNKTIIPRILGLKYFGTIDFSHINKLKHNVLNVAINSNLQKTAFEILHKMEEKDINHVTESGNNIFLDCVMNCQFDFVDYLLHYTKKEIKYDAVNFLNGKTALHYLCRIPNENYALTLIQKCPKLIFEFDLEYNYPLTFACLHNHTKIIEKILSIIDNHSDRDFMMKTTNSQLKNICDYQHIPLIQDFCKKHYSIKFRI